MEKKNRIKLGIQMYNFIKGGDWEQIRTQKDAEDLLSQLKAAGYDGVEWFNLQFNDGLLDLPALKQHMDALGLETSSLHVHYSDPANWEQDCRIAVQRCQIFDCRAIIFAFSLPDIFGIKPGEDGSYTPAQIDQWAQEIDRVLEVMKSAAAGTGIRILYHNHNTELLKGTAGAYLLDMIHPDAHELDVYWIAKGLDGKVSSALEYVRGHKDNTAILHLKDGLDGSVVTGEMCGWGKGTYPLQDVIDCGKELGVSWLIAENDEPKNFGTSGLEDARESAAYAMAHLDFA